MIWESKTLMTILDLLMLAIGLAGFWILFRRRELLGAERRSGPLAIALGLLILGVFYLADLWIMWVLPSVTSPAHAMAAMEDLHLNYRWIVSVVALIILLLGLSRTVRGLSEQQQELRRGESLFRRIVEDQSEFIVRWLPDGTRTFVNDAYCRHVGASREKLLGRSFLPLIHGDHLKAAREKIESLSPENPLSTNEHRMVLPDGSVTWTRWTDRAFFDDGGRLVEIQSIGRDVTHRKLATEALRDSEERHRAVFEATSSGLTIRRMDDLSLVAANPAMARMYGYSVEEYLKLSPEDVAHADDQPRFAEMKEAVSREGTFRFDSAKGNRKDGTLVEVAGYFVELPYKGEPHILGVIDDVSQQKQAERQKEKDWREIERLKEELEKERDYLREEVNVSLRFGEIVGDSRALRDVLESIQKVARTDTGVLILGESGVGKELVARAIHAQSPRAAGPLVKVNCASVPRELFESEFFGHVRGAFTGAHRDRTGRFQLANRGTIFLDEVAEIPIELQGKLLRVLQEGELERVGEEKTRRVDVRVIAATNRDLRGEVDAGRFRDDLYYRIHKFPIEVPPLRQRREDIVPLAAHFLGLICKELDRKEMSLSRSQAEALGGYDWPGNVRELSNVIERAVILSTGSRLRLDLALPALRQTEGEEPGQGLPADRAFVTAAEMKRRERENLIAALDHSGWKISGEDGAAELLGMKPSTLRYQMKILGLRQPG